MLTSKGHESGMGEYMDLHVDMIVRFLLYYYHNLLRNMRLQNVWTFIAVLAFSALTLLGGRQEGHPACKKTVVRCWRGYLSGVRCRLAYGPADGTATHYLLLQ